ncbi:metal-sulfur cluster assembly factor [Nocardioides endophyticus]
MLLAMSSEADSDRVAGIRRALQLVVDPCSIATGVPISIVDMGLVLDVSVDGEAAQIKLCMTSPICMQITNILNEIRKHVLAIPGINEVEVPVDAQFEWLPDMMSTRSRERLRAVRPVATG